MCDTIYSSLNLVCRLFWGTTTKFPKISTSNYRSEHYQLSGSIAMMTRDNAVQLKHSIEEHCEGNPFSQKTPLKNIVSSALIPDSAKSDILNFKEKGQARFHEFIKDRLLPYSELFIWSPMKKIKLKTFSNWMEKKQNPRGRQGRQVARRTSTSWVLSHYSEEPA